MGRVGLLSAEPPPILEIGGVLGDSDSESMKWARAIGELSREVETSGPWAASPLRVSVQFHVDGRLAPNEFVGVRTGRFNRRDAHLVVQAAVPNEVGVDRRAVLVALLMDVVAEAENDARRRGMAESLDEIRAVVHDLAHGT